MSGRREARATEAQVGQSFGRVVAELFELEEARATQLIEEGAVFVSGRRLRDPDARAKLGDRLMEARVIPDIEGTIVETINAVRGRFDYVFTTQVGDANGADDGVSAGRRG